MKTPFLLSFAFLLFLGSAEAQLSFGIKSSQTKAWFTEKDEDAGKMAGMGITFQLSKRFGKILEVGIEPGIVQRGTSERFGNEYLFMCCFGDCLYPDHEIFDYQANTLKSSYLQMPIMTKAHLPTKKGIFDLYAKLGGGPSWLASGSYYTRTYDEETFAHVPESKNIEFTDNHPFNRWDWGVNAGLGLGIKIGSGMVVFETEYYRGFSKVVNYADFKNRSQSYSLGYSINL